jgi:hypothetical protein
MSAKEAFCVITIPSMEISDSSKFAYQQTKLIAQSTYNKKCS